MIRRRRQHLAQLDKDCYYLQILQKGHAQLVQGRHELPSNQAVAAMFYSGEPYDLQCLADIRALYLEIPRESLRSRLARQDFPIAGNVGIGSGVGKLAAQLCVNLAAESRAITHADKARLGGELLNIVALALDRDRSDTDGDPHRQARLSLISPGSSSICPTLNCRSKRSPGITTSRCACCIICSARKVNRPRNGSGAGGCRNAMT